MLRETIYVEGSGTEDDVRVDVWLKDLLPRTPGAVRKVVQRELIMAAREFYEQSTAWRTVLGPLDIRADKSVYWLSPYDAYANVLRVLWVTFNGRPLEKYAYKPGTDIDSAESPTGFWVEPPDTLNLLPVPSVAHDDSLYIGVVLAPKRQIRHLPKIAEQFHYDALLDGALSRLYAHPAKPYSNKELATYHGGRFRAAIGKYAGMVKEGYLNAPSWSFPSFGK